MYELLAEIDSLRREKHSAPSQPSPHVSFQPAYEGLQPDTSPILTQFRDEGSAQELQTWEIAAEEPDLSYRNAQDPPLPHASTTSLPRVLQDLSVSGEDVDACFQIFLQHYLSYVPILENSLRPDDCYVYSPLLFWTILAIGSMRFERDPTLIIAIGPMVMELAKDAVFSCKDVIATIQSFTLLCTWPMPVETLERDPSPALAGAALQLAINSGLHVWGIGQDFSRRRLNPGGQNSVDFRAKLWVNCLIVCQRVNIAFGVSPPVLPDTYQREKYSERLSATLSPSIEFQRRLCLLHSEGIITLEKTLNSKVSDAYTVALKSEIENIVSDLKSLRTRSPSSFDQFLLDGAVLQISCFHMLLPQSALSSETLFELYDIAVVFAELGAELDQKQKIAEHAPPFFSRIMFLACCVILRIARSSLREALDLKKGREVYFKTIILHKRLSIRHDDAYSRATVILSQLWSGKMIEAQTRRSAGQVRVKCRSRLGMSLLYDCWWYWRQEFQGHPDPYPDEENRSDESEDNMALQATPTSTDFGNMDLWWPSYEIFTGTYAQDADSRSGGLGNLTELEPNLAPAYHSLHTLSSPFAAADRSEQFPP
ncbi:hypothetical protein Z517_03746 [Fonsecaea pedrosoi CBS 271.37]|uniref:Transcription factor domain-containing protein n=1 Tax=Fonsecaea pedrosoi CBS 271.37 TaxID=1442368 RepID=A0A0D2E3B7_9EURO|nr:uncharacterized protein Z517_03746 [Fonsecaea pedrosoi CBS 271.37]KIW84496.1 hypothetical protein Z517_03746 [Fonsecaea pedrosoi CBS 271.37]